MMKNQVKISNNDKDLTMAFLLFVFIKAYRETFLSSFPKIIKLIYESGLLVRYSFLIILLFVHSVMPYLLILTPSLCILQYFEVIQYPNLTFLGLNLPICLLHYVFSIIIFVILKYYVPYYVSEYANLTLVISSIIVVLFIQETFLFLLTYGSDRFFSGNFLAFFIVVGFITYLILIFVLDNLIKSINFFLLFILIILASPKNIKILSNKIVFNYFNLKPEYIRIFFVALCSFVTFIILLYYMVSLHLFLHTVYIFLFVYIVSLLLIANFIGFVDGEERKSLIKKLFYIIPAATVPILLILIGLFFLFVGFRIIFLTLIAALIISFCYDFILALCKEENKLLYLAKKLWLGLANIVSSVSAFFIGCLIFFVGCFISFLVFHFFYHQIIVTALWVIMFVIIFAIFLLSKRFLLNRLTDLSKLNVDSITQHFNTERSPQNRISILQSVLSSKTPPTEAENALKEMARHEEKRENPSQEVLDEIYKVLQTVRQEQYQTDLMDDVSPIVEDSLKSRAFDFTDSAHNNKHITPILRLDSARQQLLNWLKGETPTKPSIDKLLIYQWQDYEIGLGLKYSGQMGGDFYDVFQLPAPHTDNRLGVLIGDFSNHGVESALDLSKANHFWPETDLTKMDVLTSVRAFEQHFKITIPRGKSCSLCYLHLTEKAIDFCDAGLRPPILIKNHQIETTITPAENLGPIGVPTNPVKQPTCVALKPAEMLIIYTDGLFENHSPEGKQFGENALKQLILDHHQDNLKTLIETVFEAVYQHCQPLEIDDDETLLVIRRVSTAD